MVNMYVFFMYIVYYIILHIRYTFFVKYIHKSFSISTIIYLLKGRKPKRKGCTNFCECCELTKKVYLMYIVPGLTTLILLLLVIGVLFVNFTRDLECLHMYNTK